MDELIVTTEWDRYSVEAITHTRVSPPPGLVVRGHDCVAPGHHVRPGGSVYCVRLITARPAGQGWQTSIWMAEVGWEAEGDMTRKMQVNVW